MKFRSNFAQARGHQVKSCCQQRRAGTHVGHLLPSWGSLPGSMPRAGPQVRHLPISQDHSLRLLELFSHKAYLLLFYHLLFFSFCFEIRSTLEVVHDQRNIITKNMTKTKVDKLIIHPYFDSWLMDNDIALLLLKSPFNLSVTRVPICLSQVTDIQRWRNCWVSGWGTTSELL